ncbi:glycosyltransferase [Mesorhizobium sp. M0152]|uniref:glycosyltransferase family 2 protein n=1 Tax=Mesorhizobium sp. M0152 TaxID=2956898 RepID=UPI00333D2C68
MLPSDAMTRFGHSPTLAEENESSMIQDKAIAGGVLPMFNADQTTGATLASIRRQTYQVLGLVAVDDGSTDGSASIVTAYAEKDQRIQRLRKENGGVAAARNLGAAAMAAEFLHLSTRTIVGLRLRLRFR